MSLRSTNITYNKTQNFQLCRKKNAGKNKRLTDKHTVVFFLLFWINLVQQFWLFHLQRLFSYFLYSKLFNDVKTLITFFNWKGIEYAQMHTKYFTVDRKKESRSSLHVICLLLFADWSVYKLNSSLCDTAAGVSARMAFRWKNPTIIQKQFCSEFFSSYSLVLHEKEKWMLAAQGQVRSWSHLYAVTSGLHRALLLRPAGRGYIHLSWL